MLAEGTRQHLQLDFVFELALLFRARFASGLFIDDGQALVQRLLDRGGRHRFGLCLQLEDVLTADHLDQRAMLFAAGLNPATGGFLGCTAGSEARLRQALFQVVMRGHGEAGADAIEDGVLEHRLPFG